MRLRTHLSNILKSKWWLSIREADLSLQNIILKLELLLHLK